VDEQAKAKGSIQWGEDVCVLKERSRNACLKEVRIRGLERRHAILAVKVDETVDIKKIRSIANSVFSEFEGFEKRPDYAIVAPPCVMFIELKSKTINGEEKDVQNKFMGAATLFDYLSAALRYWENTEVLSSFPRVYVLVTPTSPTEERRLTDEYLAKKLREHLKAPERERPKNYVSIDDKTATVVWATLKKLVKTTTLP